ncbi:disease resistance protein RGA5 isoform X4 [Triticum aestivum]|nr:disease resistance protein RGA5-like isoform X4 [Triticum aestivum]
MAPLNDHQSRNLFFGRVFGSEDACPTDIKEDSYKIIRKCGCLPLAIVSIASLLASESNIAREKWKHIQDSLSSTSEGMKDLVSLMYNSLPPRLRTCLLYLNMYQQGYVIKKDVLVKQWVAEGFLNAVEGRDTEEIAEGYFDELVSKGMVQAVDTSTNGEVLSCTVHQIVLDFIRHKSMEENFVITVDYFQSTVALPDKVRRLSVQFGGVKSAYIPESIVTSQVRSLIFWGFVECVPSITDYGLLRVLILHIWADEDNESFDLSGMGELFLLKYLEIECNITVKLPDKDKIQWLQHLETLQVDASLSEVPSDIVNMKRLLHIRLRSEYILPSVAAHMTSLRTLGYFDIGSHSEENVLHLGRLTNLQDLQLTWSTVGPAEKLAKNVQLLGSILEKLTFCHSLTLVPAASGSSCVNIPEDGFSMGFPPPGLLLRRMELSWRCCVFFSLPKWFEELNKLSILKIGIRRLLREDIDLLKGLPALTALSLYIQTVPALTALTLYIHTISGGCIVIDKGGFQALTYFKFMCAEPCLFFVQGAMPRVQKLVIGFNSSKWKPHTFGTAGFCHLTGLTEVSVKLGTWGTDELDINDAESKLVTAVSNHTNSPISRVQFVDMISYGVDDKRTATEEKRGGGGVDKFGMKAAESASYSRISNHMNSSINSSQWSDVISCGSGNKSSIAEEVEEKLHQIRDRQKKKRERSVEQPSVLSFFPEKEVENPYEIEYRNKKIKYLEERVHKPLVNTRYVRKDGASTPLKHRTQSANLVTGAFSSLLPKILELLNDKYDLRMDIKKNIESLYKELEGMQAVLHDLARREQAQLDAVVMIWAKEVRDLSYNVEDMIDSLTGEEIRGLSEKTPFFFLVNDTDFIYENREKVINEIREKVKGVASRREKYKVDDRIVAAYPKATDNVDPPLLDLFQESEEVIGIEAQVEEVIRQLKGHDWDNNNNKLKIVSIVGMAGSGKTTLAKAIAKAVPKEVLHDTVFVSVSQDPNMKRVLMDILLQIDEREYRSLTGSTFDAKLLINIIRRVIGSKRYFIVIDDIWDVKSWKFIKDALDTRCGSRVVITTRLLEVAVNAGDVYKLKALSHSHSGELFNTRLFGGKDNVPRVVPEVPEKLLQKCGGVPLAIITMASLFARKPRNYCSKVHTNVSFGSAVGGNRDVDETRRILLSSYYNLPYHLRACLLHLQVFPEDYLITEETLIWKWAAEGLIVEEPGRGLFEIGDGYFKELIDSSVVMPVEDDSDYGTIVGCRVHYLVFDMICSLSAIENFVTIEDGSSQYSLIESKQARRLGIQKWTTENGDPLANIGSRSLRSFNTTGCRFSVELSLSRFKLLRVIAIEECTLLDGDLSPLGKLILLRYLGLYHTLIKKLPEDIGELIYLQTLDLRGTRVHGLPWEVTQISQLKCLRADGDTAMPYGMGKLTSLEELRLGAIDTSADFVDGLGRLTELRELEIRINQLDVNEAGALVQSLKKLEKIQVLRLVGFPWPPSRVDELNWGNFDPPQQLRELHLSIPSTRLPAWVHVSRVPMLSHLVVSLKSKEDQDLDILGALPELSSLQLVLPSKVVLSITGRSGAFPRLRYFRTSVPAKFLRGAMPTLEFLHFDANFDFDPDFAASTLGNLPSLQKVEVEITSNALSFESMNEVMKRAVDQHRNHPSLRVIKVDHVHAGFLEQFKWPATRHIAVILGGSSSRVTTQHWQS